MKREKEELVDKMKWYVRIVRGEENNKEEKEMIFLIINHLFDHLILYLTKYLTYLTT